MTPPAPFAIHGRRHMGEIIQYPGHPTASAGTELRWSSASVVTPSLVGVLMLIRATETLRFILGAGVPAVSHQHRRHDTDHAPAATDNPGGPDS